MLEIAYSPCPNDTFCFDALINKKIDAPFTPLPVLADIQQLNSWAYEKRYPVTKVSTYCLGKITKDYVLLPSGAAISHTGPKLIAKTAIDLATLKNKTIAIPGLDTTAYLLFRAIFGNAGKFIPCRYEQIVPLVTSGEADVGLIIHETRFLFEKFGLVELADLGSLFYECYHCPVPLGVIVARRDLSPSLLKEISHAINRSVSFALSQPESSQNYVLTHSQEKDPVIVKQHIETYVNQETVCISEQGMQAITTLFDLAIGQDLLPKEAKAFL